MEKIKQAKDIIIDSNTIIIFAGAGMSVDSGLKTWKGNESVDWYKLYGKSYEELCDTSMFVYEKSLAKKFWNDCYENYEKNKPHDGYKIILE